VPATRAGLTIAADPPGGPARIVTGKAGVVRLSGQRVRGGSPLSPWIMMVAGRGRLRGLPVSFHCFVGAPEMAGPGRAFVPP